MLKVICLQSYVLDPFFTLILALLLLLYNHNLDVCYVNGKLVVIRGSFRGFKVVIIVQLLNSPKTFFKKRYIDNFVGGFEPLPKKH